MKISIICGAALLIIVALALFIRFYRYKVKFYSNGGGRVRNARARKGEYFAMPKDPSRSGYAFGGWFEDKALTVRFTATKIERRRGMKAYAKWVEGSSKGDCAALKGKKDEKRGRETERDARVAKRRRTTIIYILLVFFAIVALFPLYYLIITAFKSEEEAELSASLIPKSFEIIENIKFVLSHKDYNVVRMFLNTMLVFALKTTGTCVTCSIAAYGFAMYKFPGKNIIFFLLLSTMMIPGELLGIPIYEFMVNTGLKSVAYIPLWLASWFATDIFVIFMLKQFFETVPKALIEAARIDGYNEFQIFFKIVLPLNVPVFVTVILLNFVGTYNDLYGPALYVTEKSDWLMAQSINIFENLYPSGGSYSVVPWNYVSVATLIAMMPVVLLFSFMQKKFMESVAGVGIKG